MNRQNRHLVVLAIAVVNRHHRELRRLPCGRAHARSGGPVGPPVRGGCRARACPWAPADRARRQGCGVAGSQSVGGRVRQGQRRRESRAASRPCSRTSRSCPPSWRRREGGAGLPSAIPRGMRAISVKVNDVIGVAGFVQPGSRVDLMVTIRSARTA